MRQPSLVKMFLTLVLMTIIFFMLFNGFLLQFIENNQWDQLNQTTKGISTSYFLRLFEMEIPFLKLGIVQANHSPDLSEGVPWLNFLAFNQFKDPQNLIKQEIPVFSELYDDQKVDSTDESYDFPIELYPPENFFQEEKSKGADTKEDTNPQQENIATDAKKKDAVFIYHTHNRESFLPEIKTAKANEAYHPTINITLVGRKLENELERLGIGTIVSTKDYWPELEKYSMSYKYSLKTVQAALQQNRDYQFIFDIHRDSHSREITTRKINGKDYAAIYFIIGTGNKNYELNYEFAKKIHESLEKHYPGISRGIYTKDKKQGTDGEYNQSVSPHSLTIEIGGVENTLEEEYRTASALAEAVADIYWEAIRVEAQPKE